MRDVYIAITAASYSGNKGAAAMLQSSIRQLHERYGSRLQIRLMSVYPRADRDQVPWDFVKVVSCKPEQLIFLAFPLAVLYRLLSWLWPVRKLLLKNKILKAFSECDAVLDEAGISFVDSRGFVMNTYAFICAAVPLLVGTPVLKYSQAMGLFENPYNRFLAKWILPRLSFIAARGRQTYDSLKKLGLSDTVSLCADGAFSMEDDLVCEEKVAARCGADPFYACTLAPSMADNRLVGLSISSVVDKKCAKRGISYRDIMAGFIDRLNEEGYQVLILANAARLGSEKSRNNDLMVGDAIYQAVHHPDQVRWYHEEMQAEEIRAYISRCRFLVASRFHAMIGALQKKVPVLLIGWSHKYQEVLDQWGLGTYAADFSGLSKETLWKAFQDMAGEESQIRASLETHYEEVIESSRSNILLAGQVIDGILEKKNKSRGPLTLTEPDRYLGSYVCCCKGYASDPAFRENAASGGMVTAFLAWLLREKIIDGAWVTRTRIQNGELGYETFIATTQEDLCDASSSIYMHMPLLKHVQMLRNFPGKLAVVLIPCQMKAFEALLEKEPALREKVVLRLGLFCSGNHEKGATLLPLEKLDISLQGASRFYYRRGHWRGMGSVLYQDGTRKDFSYPKSICAYKNAYYFERESCMTCQDHFAQAADLAFGDIWLGEMKKEPVKHTCTLVRTQEAKALLEGAAQAGALFVSPLSSRDMLRGQKRALVFKYNCAQAKVEAAKKKGIMLSIRDTRDTSRWNHRLAFYLAEKDRRLSKEHPEKLSRIPMRLIYLRMCFIRVLLSF